MNHTGLAFQEIGYELRTQYFPGYTPSTVRHDGWNHKIRVDVRAREFKVQVRRGYYAPLQYFRRRGLTP